MDFKDIQDRDEAGVYDVPGELFPRETLKQSDPKKYRELKKEHRFEGAKKQQLFEWDLKQVVEEELDKNLLEEQWKAIWKYVYGEGHANGYPEIINVTISLVEILKTF